MKILVSGLSMSYLSGQPLYCYELCLELKRQKHDVTMISRWGGPLTGAEGYKLKENFIEYGIRIKEWNEPLDNDYDLIIASESVSEEILNRLPEIPAINVVHSEYDCETPITDRPQITKYVCIRHSIVRHIVDVHGIPENKCVVIYNGVDRKRFKKKKKAKRDYYKIVVPCTLDTMREPFLNKLIDGANEKRRIYFYGMDCGADLHQSPYVEIHPDKFNIEDEIADADEVAGILLGRVNLEAWSCGVKSSIYDPHTLEHKIYDTPLDFNENHNITNVVKKILQQVINLDETTIVIAHHDQREKLNILLNAIPRFKNIVIRKGGTFAENNNRGFLSVDTPNVLFINDDTIPTLSLIRGMQSLLNRFDIVGCLIEKGCTGFNINAGVLEEVNDSNMEMMYPSGCCLIMKKEVYSDVGMFSEKFRNGCEDVDFYLRAEDKKYKIGIYTSGKLIHDEASSTGRFDNLNENIIYFNKKWRGRCQIKSATSSEV
jgi:hypothetical protein